VCCDHPAVTPSLRGQLKNRPRALCATAAVTKADRISRHPRHSTRAATTSNMEAHPHRRACSERVSHSGGRSDVGIMERRAKNRYRSCRGGERGKKEGRTCLFYANVPLRTSNNYT
jgi:hypothetical protein